MAPSNIFPYHLNIQHIRFRERERARERERERGRVREGGGRGRQEGRREGGGREAERSQQSQHPRNISFQASPWQWVLRCSPVQSAYIRRMSSITSSISSTCICIYIYIYICVCVCAASIQTGKLLARIRQNAGCISAIDE